MRVIKKILKAIGILFLALLGLIAVCLICTTILHNVKMKSNKAFLAEQGYYHPVSVGDHSLNLVRFGGNADGHRIIAFSGSGPGFPIEIKPVVSELKEENQVYYLARPGYDGSDDVKDDMTISFVVEDCRKALQNAGVEAPYVLMPHSAAGLLATYWAAKYPDEIEAVVNIEGVIPMAPDTFTEEQLAEFESESGGMGMIRTLFNLGIADVAGDMLVHSDESYSEDDQRADRAMQLMTMSSRAFYSEVSNAFVSMRETYEILEPNDIPKLYINATNGYKTLEEYEAADRLSEYRINELTPDFTGTEEARRAKAYELEWEEMQNHKKEVMEPYFEKIGNCKVADLPGGHFIHWEKPHECAEIIKNFLKDVK